MSNLVVVCIQHLEFWDSVHINNAFEWVVVDIQNRQIRYISEVLIDLRNIIVR